MGHYTLITGAITFDPPMNWTEIKSSPFFMDEDRRNRDVKLEVDTRAVDTEEGRLQVMSASRLIPASEEPYKAYSFLEHIREFFTKHGAGRTFTGHMLCDEGGAGDLWRVEIVNGEVMTTSAVCLWPEDVQGLRDAVRYYDPEGVKEAVSNFLLTYSNEAGKPRQ